MTGAATAAGAAGAAGAAAGAAGAATGGEAAGPAGASSGHGQRNQLMIQTCINMFILIIPNGINKVFSTSGYFIHWFCLGNQSYLDRGREALELVVPASVFGRALIACHFSMLETEVHVSAQHHLKDAHNWVHLGLNRLNTWPNCWWIWWTKILAAHSCARYQPLQMRRFRTSDSQVDVCRLVKQLVSQPETEIQMVPYSISCWSWWYLEGWGPFCIATEGSSKTEKGKVCKADSNSSSQRLILLSVGQCWAIFSQLSPVFLEPSEAGTVFAGSWKKSKFKEATISASRGFGRGLEPCWSIWNKGPEKPWMPHSTNSNWDRVPGFSSAHCLWFLSRSIGFYYRQEKTILTRRSSSMLWISVDPAKLNGVKIQYQCSPFIWSAAILSKLGTCLRLYARVG